MRGWPDAVQCSAVAGGAAIMWFNIGASEIYHLSGRHASSRDAASCASDDASGEGRRERLLYAAAHEAMIRSGPVSRLSTQPRGSAAYMGTPIGSRAGFDRVFASFLPCPARENGNGVARLRQERSAVAASARPGTTVLIDVSTVPSRSLRNQPWMPPAVSVSRKVGLCSSRKLDYCRR
ncbi:hypothetical protein GUJ93_ZPchr0001g29603 [Zizania palustris]|uniref:Uncharacterized protein n=1 Tax=Zizania palustris TaxID=103762 RepID=A0A8J5RJE8_ZIZPA|nr:hypothetical protein GUJ93_ZPchr0001g29603 [Zizania palustris]